MLRASATRTKRTVAIRSIADPGIDPQLEWGRELLAFTDAAVNADAESMASARDALELVGGSDAVVRAAGCVGTFQMMNRLMDVLGVRADAAWMPVADDLGIVVPDHLCPD